MYLFIDYGGNVQGDVQSNESVDTTAPTPNMTSEEAAAKVEAPPTAGMEADADSGSIGE